MLDLRSVSTERHALEDAVFDLIAEDGEPRLVVKPVTNVYFDVAINRFAGQPQYGEFRALYLRVRRAGYEDSNIWAGAAEGEKKGNDLILMGGLVEGVDEHVEPIDEIQGGRGEIYNLGDIQVAPGGMAPSFLQGPNAFHKLWFDLDQLGQDGTKDTRRKLRC